MTAASRSRYDDSALRSAFAQYLGAEPARRSELFARCAKTAEATVPDLEPRGAGALVFVGRLLCGARRLGVDVALPLPDDPSAGMEVHRSLEAAAATFMADPHLGTTPTEDLLYARRAAESVLEQAVCKAAAHPDAVAVALFCAEHVAVTVARSIFPGMEPRTGFELAMLGFETDVSFHPR